MKFNLFLPFFACVAVSSVAFAYESDCSNATQTFRYSAKAEVTGGAAFSVWNLQYGDLSMSGGAHDSPPLEFTEYKSVGTVHQGNQDFDISTSLVKIQQADRTDTEYVICRSSK